MKIHPMSITARLGYFVLGAFLAAAMLTVETWALDQKTRIDRLEQYIQYLQQMMQQNAPKTATHPSLVQPAFRPNTTEAA